MPQAGIYFELMKIAYRMVLRSLLKAAIDDPDKEWDEAVLKVLDSIFCYEGKGST